MGPLKKSTTFTREDLEDWNRQQYDDSDKRNIGAAEHQARNDYQDSGSPFGELSERDRSSKSDTEAK